MNRKRPLLVIAAVTGLLVSACGGGTSAQRAAVEQAGSEPAAAVPAASGETPITDAMEPEQSAEEPADSAGSSADANAPSGAVAPAAAAGATFGKSAGKSGKAPAAAKAVDAPTKDSVAGAKQAAGAAPAAPAARGGATDVGVAANSIKLGHVGIYSGPVGSFGDDLSHACLAGLEAINDQGGIAGRKLDVKVRDDAWDATKGSNAVRDLVEREKVFAFACGQSVPTNDAVTPYLDAQKVPSVGGDGWGEAQYAGAWSFPVGASGENEAANLATYQVKKQGAARIGILHWNNTTGKAYADTYRKVAESLGAKVVVTQAANFDDPSTSIFIAQARSQNVDTVTTMVDPGIFARMVREAAAQGYKPKNGYSGGAALYFQATPGLTGPAAEGTIASIDWMPDDPAGPAKGNAGYRAYKDTVERYYPDIDHSNWTKAGYVGSKLLGDALKRLGGNLTRQGLRDDLDRVTNFNTGLGPKLTFRPGDHRANTTSYLAQLQKSGNSLVWRYLAGPFTGPRKER